VGRPGAPLDKIEAWDVSFARRSSAFSGRSSRSSAASSGDVVVLPPVECAARSSASIQFRNVAGLMSSSWPTCRRAASFDSP